MAPNEDSINLAMEALLSGRVKSIKAAATMYAVDRRTLGRRLDDRSRSRAQVAAEQQLLSATQERLLVQWILYEEARGLPPTRAGLHNMVTFLVRFTNQAQHVGKNWVDRFLTRHPEVCSKVGTKLDIARYEGTQLDVISTWFQRLKGVVDRLKIHPSDIANMDETGLALGCTRNTSVLGSSTTKKAYRKSSEEREWVSIIECITATGPAL
jgi:hypothetical protein